MYLDYFKLKEMPFKITPDPRFIYMTPQHEEALGKCHYTISERGGLIAIYGAIGMGKTTIARRLLEIVQSEEDTQVAMLITPALKTPNAFLNAVMGEFGVPPRRSYALSLEAFQNFILDCAEKGKNLAVIIDEAQKLTPRMMDVLHTLLNFESNTQKFLQIVLIGQNELATNIDKIPEIKSRVARFGDLQNLTQDDTSDMIAFRWQTASAGKSSHPFSDKALDAIYLFSKGIPREINKLCHDSLLRAMNSEVKEVTAEMVVDAAKEMRLTGEEV